MTLAEKVYEKLRLVPKGRVTTYKYLAEAVGSRAYRAVGQIMRTNPDAPRTPCHRVVASDGRLGGFKGARGGKEIEEKVALLKSEGVGVKNGKVENFEEVKFAFK